MSENVTDKGRLPLWRKFKDDWKWKDPLTRSAWLWMMVEAAYSPHNGLERGQLYFSIYWAPEVWGMTVHQARHFLKRCVAEGDILWKRGTGGRKNNNCEKRTDNRTDNRTVNGTDCGIITLVNYGKYNSLSADKNTVQNTDFISDNRAILEGKIKKERKEVPPLIPPQGEPDTKPKSRKPKPSRDTAWIQMELNKIDLEKFHHDFPNKDVDAVFCEFSETCLTGTAKKAWPNPYDYTNFSKGFRTWLARAPDRTCTPNLDDDPWIAKGRRH